MRCFNNNVATKYILTMWSKVYCCLRCHFLWTPDRNLKITCGGWKPQAQAFVVSSNKEKQIHYFTFNNNTIKHSRIFYCWIFEMYPNVINMSEVCLRVQCLTGKLFIYHTKCIRIQLDAVCTDVFVPLEATHFCSC